MTLKGWSVSFFPYRLKEEEAVGLPKIPAQPIGYDDAKVLLQKMGGPLPPGNGEKFLYNRTIIIK